MRKIFGLILIFAVAAGLISCLEEHDNFSAKQIVGTWETTQAYVGGDWINIPSYSDMYATMTFHEDGSYYGDSELFGSGWGTYTLNGKTLNTYQDGKLFYTYTIKSLTDTSAEVTMAYKNSNIGLRLKKCN